MGRVLVVAGMGVALIAASARTAAAEPSAVAHRCKSGFRHAVINGRHTCLKVGQRCNQRFDRQYRRYGFQCHAGRLTRVPPALTAAERAWVEKARSAATGYGDAFASKIEPIEAEGFFAALFANDAQADAAWQEFLAHLRSCNAVLDAVGRPPSERLLEPHSYILRACERFDLAVGLLDAGVQARDRELFDDGWDAMSAGEIYLAWAVAILPRTSS